VGETQGLCPCTPAAPEVLPDMSGAALSRHLKGQHLIDTQVFRVLSQFVVLRSTHDTNFNAEDRDRVALGSSGWARDLPGTSRRAYDSGSFGHSVCSRASRTSITAAVVQHTRCHQAKRQRKSARCTGHFSRFSLQPQNANAVTCGTGDATSPAA
jgi:hypothetical protein